jgi:hypothetical protein
MTIFPVIVIFVYNRPDHTKKLLNSLESCYLLKKHKIVIFSDNFKISDDLDKFNVLKVRKIIQEFSKKKSCIIYYNKTNVGLYKNVINGVTKVLKKNLTVIVLEDDLILNKNFLLFMNKAFKFIKNKQEVSQISGYSYPINYNSNKAYYLTLSSCWGWGINKSNWIKFKNFIENRKNITSLYKKIFDSNKMLKSFNFNNTFNYFKILKKHINYSVNSWGILFYLFCFDRKKLILYPPYSLVKNTGFDGSGNHKSFSNLFNKMKNFNKKYKIIIPKKVMINQRINSKIETFFKKDLSFFSKLTNFICHTL